jgi:hypothetical protein
MPHDFNHTSDPMAAAAELLNRAKKRRRSYGSGPDGGDEPRRQPRSAMGKRVFQMLVAAVVAILTALAGEYGLHEGSDRVEQPEPGVITAQRAYAQRDVRVYTAPSGDSAVVRKVERGESVLLAEPDSRKWARVYEPDADLIGFVYVYRGNFGPMPPAMGDFSPAPADP